MREENDMARSFLYRFLNLVDGTWRNAVYLECGVCPFGLQCSSDYLLTVDYDGTPLLYSVCQFQKESGESVDKAECISVMSRSVFEQLYSKWFLWYLPQAYRCHIHPLTHPSEYER